MYQSIFTHPDCFVGYANLHYSGGTQMMTIDEERMKILKLIEEKKISVDQAAKLLSTLQEKTEDAAYAPNLPADAPRWFKVRVTDSISGRAKASVSIPFSLLDLGLRIGAQFSPEISGVDLTELSQILRSGDAEGKLIDVVDEEDGEHVEVFVE
jgi:hypothetical protein